MNINSEAERHMFGHELGDLIGRHIVLASARGCLSAHGIERQQTLVPIKKNSISYRHRGTTLTMGAGSGATRIAE
jgi:hypothetical protein